MGSTVQQSLFVIWVGSHQGDTWRHIASHDQDCFVCVQLGCCADQRQYLRWLTSPWPWDTGQGQGRGKHTGSLQTISRLPALVQDDGATLCPPITHKHHVLDGLILMSNVSAMWIYRNEECDATNRKTSIIELVMQRMYSEWPMYDRCQNFFNKVNKLYHLSRQ